MRLKHILLLLFIVKSSLAFSQTEDVNLNLLFFDDFSYQGPVPDPNLWVDEPATVFVNNDLFGRYSTHPQPPSYGFASFDSRDENAHFYTVGCHAQFEQRDVLTSVPIDLSDYEQGDEVYLSFFLQPEGLGLNSDPAAADPSKFDKFYLEFLYPGPNGNWNLIDEIPYEEVQGIHPFLFKVYPITGQNYFHDQFQFRMVNHGRGTRVRNVWNIDYVRISTGGIPTETFSDVVFTQTPKSILSNYTSMPWQEFVSHIDEELSPNFYVNLFNHFEQNIPVNNARLSIQETLSGQVLLDDYEMLTLPQQGVPANSSVYYNNEMNPVIFNELKADLANFEPQGENVFLEMTYNFEQDNEPSDQSYYPVKRNNTASNSTVFSNYYAYDDGTAEQYHSLSYDPYATMAVKFHSHQEQVLSGIQLHHHDGEWNCTGKNMEFVVKAWIGSLENEPFTRSIYTSQSINGYSDFTTYYLLDGAGNPAPLNIPAGTDFYVGFQTDCDGEQSHITDCLWIGIDKNNPQAMDNAFRVYSDGNFTSLPASFSGAPMIRPVVGMGIYEKMIITFVPEDDEELCAGQDNFFDFWVEIIEAPGEPECTDPLRVDIKVLSENSIIRRTLTYDPVTGKYYLKVRLNFEEGGLQQFSIRAENDCAIGVMDAAFEFIDSPQFSALEQICNPNPVPGWDVYVAHGDYYATVIHSPDNACTIGEDPSIAEVRLSRYFGLEYILLNEGFYSPPGSHFTARIWEGCHQFAFEEAPAEDRQAEVVPQNPFSEFQVFPNPFSNTLNVEYQIDSDKEVSVSLYLSDLTGKQIKAFMRNELHQSGAYSLALGSSDLQAGAYLLTMIVDGIPKNYKLVKTLSY